MRMLSFPQHGVVATAIDMVEIMTSPYPMNLNISSASHSQSRRSAVVNFCGSIKRIAACRGLKNTNFAPPKAIATAGQVKCLLVSGLHYLPQFRVANTSVALPTAIVQSHTGSTSLSLLDICFAAPTCLYFGSSFTVSFIALTV